MSPCSQAGCCSTSVCSECMPSSGQDVIGCAPPCEDNHTRASLQLCSNSGLHLICTASTQVMEEA
jgi:hypothetical protein